MFTNASFAVPTQAPLNYKSETKHLQKGLENRILFGKNPKRGYLILYSAFNNPSQKVSGKKIYGKWGETQKRSTLELI
jgi:hypothetical protein